MSATPTLEHARWKPGVAVGARRWPAYGGTPWRGETLHLDDVRAWTLTLAFPMGTPSQEEVTAHVDRCIREWGGFATSVPVLWDFGSYKRVWWERTNRDQYGGVCAYAEDLRAWEVHVDGQGGQLVVSNAFEGVPS